MPARWKKSTLSLTLICSKRKIESRLSQKIYSKRVEVQSSAFSLPRNTLKLLRSINA